MKQRWSGRRRRWATVAAVVAAVGTAVFGAGAAAAVPAAAAGTSCGAAYSVQSDWGSGFTASITVTNTGTAAITGWSLSYSYTGNQQLTQGWSGTWAQSGHTVTVSSLSYNGSLAPGASTQLGANFSYSGSNAAPASVACTAAGGGGGTPPPAGTITASPSSLQVTQGSTGTTALSLSTAPSANVTVTVARTSGNSGLSAAPGTLTFTSANYATPQTVTISADASSTGAATFTASGSGYGSATITATEAASGGSGGTGGRVADPYNGSQPYLNPDYTAEVQAQASKDGSSTEAEVANYQTAIWMDHIGAIAGDSTHLGLQAQLNNAETQSKSSSLPVMIEVVVYDLPGRDCAALASNGEIPATSAGLTEYESQYIDPIVAIEGSSAYSNLRIVNFIEPDSLPNAVTNKSLSSCATSIPYYESGIEYALGKLHAIGPQIYNYMDIGHSGWLGWPNNMSGAGPEYAKVVSAAAGGYATVDGFVSDTANTTPADEPFLPNSTMQVGGNPLDSAKFYQYNPYFDEHHYDEAMYNEFTSSGFPSTIGMIIDTSRNGWGGSARPTSLNSSPTTVDTYVAANKVDQRPFRGDWCNVNGAGIGARPQANPYGSGDHIIADVWIKPPGESDGDYPTATHTHGDPHCDPNGTNTDNPNGTGNVHPTGSIPGFDIPAGQFFPFQFQQLVANAFPSLS
jgi:cellulose 1,4-beta-cellobiosidase